MICPACHVERADYEGPDGAWLPTCPNCGSELDPVQHASQGDLNGAMSDDKRDEWEAINVRDVDDAGQPIILYGVSQRLREGQSSPILYAVDSLCRDRLLGVLNTTAHARTQLEERVHELEALVTEARESVQVHRTVAKYYGHGAEFAKWDAWLASADALLSPQDPRKETP